MNVNQKIESALSEMVQGNIWPLSCPIDVPPDEYIVYLSELEKAENFGDDEDLDWVCYMQVHWFKKDASRKPVNYIKQKKEIRRALKKVGFMLTDIDVYYEKDTGYTHLVFSCNIEEDDLDG